MATPLGKDLVLPGELFPTLVHVCVPLAILIGGLRLLWLFLSPIPKAMPPAVERPRLLTLGRFAPLLVLLGCAAFTAFVFVTPWLKSLPHGWWNLFPFLAAVALGLIGAVAILCGVVAQSVLVDAYRGFDLEKDTGNVQRNMDAALLFAFGIIVLAAAGYYWLSPLDWSAGALPDVQRHKLVVCMPVYFAVIASLIRSCHVEPTGPGSSGRTSRYFGQLGWLVLFFVFNQTFSGILPRDHDIERYLRYRGDVIGDLSSGVQSVPFDLWRSELLSLIGLSLVIVMCVTTSIDMLARRGVTRPYIGSRTWPGFLFFGLSLAMSAVFVRYGLPIDAPFSWVGHIAIPLTLGMSLIFFFPLLWRIAERGWRYAMQTAARNLLLQILVFLLLTPIAIGLLYAASLLTATGFAALMLGAAAAAALGLPRFPAPATSAEQAPATSA